MNDDNKPSEGGNKMIAAIMGIASKPINNLIKVCGPIILSKSDTFREQQEVYKLDKARLNALSSYLKSEAEGISRARDQIREKMLASSGVERVFLQKDYELLGREINKLSTYDKVKDFLSGDGEINSTSEISDGWATKFNEVASTLNEEWRKQLLAKAFARELEEPGSVSILLLNAIASFDEKTFRQFGILINICFRLYEINFIYQKALIEIINIDGEQYKLSTIIYNLSHLNLIKYDSEDFIDIRSDAEKDTLIRYGKRVMRVRSNFGHATIQNRVYTTFFSQLGNEVAKLYDRKITENGNLFFDSYKQELVNRGYSCSEVELSDIDYQILGN